MGRGEASALSAWEDPRAAARIALRGRARGEEPEEGVSRGNSSCRGPEAGMLSEVQKCLALRVIEGTHRVVQLSPQLILELSSPQKETTYLLAVASLASGNL